MKADLKINQKDLKVLFAHTKGAYKGMSFDDWSKECYKSYMSYYNNKVMYGYNRYTYSQFVNAQILAIS